MSNETIRHRGVIIAIKDGVAKVRIMQTSACAECHAKSACTVSDQKEKIIDAEMRHDDFSIGDEVYVIVQKNIGISAVLLAYVLPFVLIIVTMAILDNFIDNDLLTGTISLGMLLPYVLLLRVFRKKLNARFRFYITEI
ncbi:MAG: SoxR reducing system RseC family protein [Paludibacteraceae bacterium]|nr:SoxR reducing system RseC family protein [Candidatus Colousia faecequi]MCQ2337792.1 SoxR reducing system RseC family protein [Paludibacteraceae bacterium]